MWWGYVSPAFAEDKCPVDHKNMSKEELDGMMAQYKRVGHEKFLESLPTSQQPEKTNLNNEEKATLQADSPGGCPVDHRNMSQEQIAAFMSSQKDSKPENTPSNDSGSKAKNKTVYDVYGQELDRANLMPSTPNQLPSPGQTKPLSTDRVKSTIPKEGEDGEDTWTYPSPQMFFNALKRKGKADGVQEDDMDTVVHVHNNMNEQTWKEVMEWEKRYHCQECENPKLKRFQGKPHELSPAARFRMWFRNYPMPFDRHDWVLDRCGKAEARYVIDYYYRDGPDPIEIHVRPAIDSVSAVVDRVRNRAENMWEAIAGGSAEQEGTAATSVHSNWSEGRVVAGDSLDDDEFSFLSKITPDSLRDVSEEVQKRCSKLGDALQEAGDNPAKMEQANVAVNYCMAQTICKPQAAKFMSALEGHGDESGAYAKMTSCLDRFHIMARRALLEASGIATSGPEFPAGVTPSVGGNPTHAPASSVENR